MGRTTMRISFLWLLVWVGLLFTAGLKSAEAADCHSTPTTAIDGCRTVVPSIDGANGVRARDLSDPAYTYISITCYHGESPDSICAGGGDFDRVLFDPLNSPCNATGLDNGATLIQDTQHNCFYRKNFGLNGVVDARQCGVWGDGIHEDGALLLNCMKIAAQTVTPAPTNALAVVTTGGGVILDNDTQLSLPGNVRLTCGATNPSSGGGNDFRIFKTGTTNLNISNAIVINPQLLASGTTVEAPIQLPNKSSIFSDCLVVASDNGGAFPYAPSIWYPKCDPTKAGCDDSAGKTFIRSAILEYSAFNPNKSIAYPTGGPASHSIAIAVGDPQTEKGGNGTTIRDVTVVGFGTCVKGAARDLTLEDCRFDCSTALDLKTPDVPFISNVRSERLLSGSQG